MHTRAHAQTQILYGDNIQPKFEANHEWVALAKRPPSPENSS